MTTTAARPRHNNAASAAHHHSNAEAPATGAVSARLSKADAQAGGRATPSNRAGVATTATASSSSLPPNEAAAVSAHLACANGNATFSGCFQLLSLHVILPSALQYVRCYFMLTLFQLHLTQ